MCHLKTVLTWKPLNFNNGRVAPPIAGEKGNIMAITVTTPSAKVGFIANGTSANASGCEELVAAVTGKKIKVRHVTFNNLTAGALSFTLGAGKTGGAVTTALIGPISVGANSSIQWDFNPLMELTAATSLTIDLSGSGAISVFAQGVIE